MQNYITPNFKFADIIPVKAQGSTVWDEKGKDYIDFAGGIAVNALGHCHPLLIRILTEQAQKLWHISNLFCTEPAALLAEKLVTATFADRVFLANSGAEANEAALKLARKYACDNFGGSKNKIISCRNSFHGRTLFTVTVGGQEKYQQGFGPLPPNIFYTPFNDSHQLEKILDADTAALIIEPIQGEGGVIAATREFLQTARRLCDKYKILLIFDEVQTGMGRTGYLFAYQHYQVTPDILTAGKALANGLPIGAMLAGETVAAAFTPGSHGTTFGGNPLVAAVAAGAFTLINCQETLDNVNNQNIKFTRELTALAHSSGKFKYIRGQGLLLGCVLADRYHGRAAEVAAAALQAGVIVTQAGPDVIRLAPSLIINDHDRQEGIERLQTALSNLGD